MQSLLHRIGPFLGRGGVFQMKLSNLKQVSSLYTWKCYNHYGWPLNTLKNTNEDRGWRVNGHFVGPVRSSGYVEAFVFWDSNICRWSDERNGKGRFPFEVEIWTRVQRITTQILCSIDSYLYPACISDLILSPDYFPFRSLPLVSLMGHWNVFTLDWYFFVIFVKHKLLIFCQLCDNGHVEF